MSENEKLFEELRKVSKQKRICFECSCCGDTTRALPGSPRIRLKLCVGCASGTPKRRRK